MPCLVVSSRWCSADDGRDVSFPELSSSIGNIEEGHSVSVGVGVMEVGDFN